VTDKLTEDNKEVGTLRSAESRTAQNFNNLRGHVHGVILKL